MAIMGIDPGLRGAIAVISDDGGCRCWLLSEVIGGRDTPFDEIVRTHGVTHIFLEKAAPRPGNSVVAMFNYGREYGRLIGRIEQMRVSYTLTPPAIWTREMHAGCDSNLDAKKKSLQAAQRLFPREQLHAGGNVRLLPHDGLIDALLLAEYGRRKLR